MKQNADPFCDKRVISSESVCSSRHFVILYNIRPTVPGHVLLVSKRHVERITELDAKEISDMHSLLRKVIPVLIKAYDAEDESYNLIVQAGENSGMSVRHFHMHIVPRNSRDRYSKKNNALYTDIERARKGLGHRHVIEQTARLRRLFSKKRIESYRT